MRAGAMADKQIMRQMEENLVALRDDLKRRDSETRTETSHSTELISRLQSELQLARETVDEMARKMVDYDDMKLRTESSLLRARKEVDKYRRDRDTCRQEGEKWRRMYQELEQALDVVKSQGASQRDKQSKEVSRLQEDLAASNQKVEELRAEAAVVSAVFTSVARDSDAISTLRPPNSSHEMISQHAEIAAIVKSIKRLLAATPRGLTPEMRKVIKFMCELVHKTVVYQEESSGLSDELAQRSDTLESATKLFERLEDKLRTVKADLTLSDEIVRHVLLLTQQSGEQKHFLKTFVEKRDFHFNSQVTSTVCSTDCLLTVSHFIQTRQKLFVELLESVHQLLQTLQSTNSSAYSQRNEAQLLQQRHEHYVEVLRLQHEQELEEAHTAVNVAQDECSREIAKHREENMRLLAQSKADFHSQLEEYKEQVVFYRENERNLRVRTLTNLKKCLSHKFLSRLNRRQSS